MNSEYKSEEEEFPSIQIIDSGQEKRWTSIPHTRFYTRHFDGINPKKSIT
jgi:hypothetical protein